LIIDNDSHDSCRQHNTSVARYFGTNMTSIASLRTLLRATLCPG
jgi:hypothetical protein